MTTIAGHVFTLEGPCSCGRRFADISGTPRDAIGKHGWAHEGIGIEREWLEIDAENQRLWSLVVGSATGNGPAAAPAGTEPSADEIAAMEAA